MLEFRWLFIFAECTSKISCKFFNRNVLWFYLYTHPSIRTLASHIWHKGDACVTCSEYPRRRWHMWNPSGDTGTCKNSCRNPVSILESIGMRHKARFHTFDLNSWMHVIPDETWSLAQTRLLPSPISCNTSNGKITDLRTSIASPLLSVYYIFTSDTGCPYFLRTYSRRRKNTGEWEIAIGDFMGSFQDRRQKRRGRRWCGRGKRKSQALRVLSAAAFVFCSQTWCSIPSLLFWQTCLLAFFESMLIEFDQSAEQFLLIWLMTTITTC